MLSSSCRPIPLFKRFRDFFEVDDDDDAADDNTEDDNDEKEENDSDVIQVRKRQKVEQDKIPSKRFFGRATTDFYPS